MAPIGTSASPAGHDLAGEEGGANRPMTTSEVKRMLEEVQGMAARLHGNLIVTPADESALRMVHETLEGLTRGDITDDSFFAYKPAPLDLGFEVRKLDHLVTGMGQSDYDPRVFVDGEEIDQLGADAWSCMVAADRAVIATNVVRRHLEDAHRRLTPPVDYRSVPVAARAVGLALQVLGAPVETVGEQEGSVAA